MIQITISDKRYQIPDCWEDVTMRKTINSQLLLKDMPTKLKELTYPEKDAKPPKLTQADHKEFLDFYLKWFVYWTGVSEGISKKIHLEDLKRAYEVLTIFMYAPNDMEHRETITHKGVTYMLPSVERLVSGTDKHMANATYEEFVEGMQLSTGLDKLAEEDLSALPLLTATFYREAKLVGWWRWKRAEACAYDEEGTKRRAELFMDLPMSDVWGAYFFLCFHLERSLSGLQTSLKGKVQGIASLKGLVGIQ